MKEIRLAYYSKPADTFRFTDLEPVLASSRRNNERFNVTGLLGLTSTHFMHYLEGPRESVSHIFSKIIHDRRHRDVTFYGVGEIEDRLIPEYPLALVGGKAFSEELCTRLFGRKTIIPSLLNQRAAMALFSALAQDRMRMEESENLLREALDDDYFEISF